MVEMGLARRAGCDIDPPPVAPLALDLVVHDGFADVFESGLAEPVVALAEFEVLLAAMAVALEQEARIAAGGPKPNPGRFDQRDGIVGSQLTQPACRRQPANPSTDHREIDRNRSLDPARG